MSSELIAKPIVEDAGSPDQQPLPQAGGRAAKTVFTLDPLEDHRWKEFVSRHPRASMFHTTMWLGALKATYGYRPVVYTTSPPDRPLENGIVFCDVNSWMTGQRLVSLPFSDHCEPLIDNEAEFQAVVTELCKWISQTAHQYFELRPMRDLPRLPELVQVHETYAFHQLDLTPGLDTIYRNFHKDSTQRKIKRAERDGVELREGKPQLSAFYRLMVMTRRRHRVPPQPKLWFETLMDCLGDDLKLRMAYYQGTPVAGMITVRHKNILVYKYGCSDVRFNTHGGMHLLYWTAIKEAKALQCDVVDFGRCDNDQEGLKVFKRRWGAAESILKYHRYAAHGRVGLTFQPAGSSWRMKAAEKVFAYSPSPLLSLMGRFLYKHVG